MFSGEFVVSSTFIAYIDNLLNISLFLHSLLAIVVVVDMCFVGGMQNLYESVAASRLVNNTHLPREPGWR